VSARTCARAAGSKAVNQAELANNSASERRVASPVGALDINRFLCESNEILKAPKSCGKPVAQLSLG
jgi:hypothetical protein